MEGYRSSTYGDGFADVYDQWYLDLPDPGPCARVLAQLDADGPVLELGIGTGRMAVSLAAQGLPVIGIDASGAMLDQLRTNLAARSATNGDGDVVAARADMVELPFAGRSVPLVLAAFNTLFNLSTADAQTACLTEVARVLRPGGHLAVEAIVAPVTPERIEDVAIRSLGIDSVVLTASVLDPVHQTITGQHIQFTEAGTKLRPWLLHYLTPTQLDEVATSVGLECTSRWADWDGATFDDASTSHVSIYTKP